MTYAKAISALADPTRRSVFEKIAAQPDNVASLAKHFPVSRPAISQHLKVLQEAGLVKAEVAGTRHIYQIDHAGLEAIKTYLDGFWGDALGAFAAEIHKQNREQ
jgi:DNA-binding transcriptional ArsR family regulator